MSKSYLEVYDHYQQSWCDISLHLRWLHDHAGGNCMEIGVREGISTAALLTGVHAHGGHLYSIDKDDYGGLYDSNRWTFIRADSLLESPRILKAIGMEDNNFRLNLLLLDGDHTYGGVMADLATYGPIANTIAVHDTHSEFVGVFEAVLAYYRSLHNGGFKRAEFFNQSSGLGVLYR